MINHHSGQARAEAPRNPHGVHTGKGDRFDQNIGTESLAQMAHCDRGQGRTHLKAQTRERIEDCLMS